MSNKEWYNESQRMITFSLGAFWFSHIRRKGKLVEVNTRCHSLSFHASLVCLFINDLYEETTNVPLLWKNVAIIIPSACFKHHNNY